MTWLKEHPKIYIISLRVILLIQFRNEVGFIKKNDFLRKLYYGIGSYEKQFFSLETSMYKKFEAKCVIALAKKISRDVAQLIYFFLGISVFFFNSCTYTRVQFDCNNVLNIFVKYSKM